MGKSRSTSCDNRHAERSTRNFVEPLTETMDKIPTKLQNHKVFR